MGGRGHKNPWRTKAVRVPEPLIPFLSQMMENFYQSDGEIFISTKLIHEPTQLEDFLVKIQIFLDEIYHENPLNIPPQEKPILIRFILQIMKEWIDSSFNLNVQFRERKKTTHTPTVGNS
jgi:hypothetical protein